MQLAFDECERNNVFVVLPEGAFFEMARSGKPLETMSKNFRLLTPHLNRIRVARRLMVVIREEIATASPCKTLVDWKFTELVHDFAEALAADDQPTIDRVQSNISFYLSNDSAAWRDGDHFKSQLLNLTRAFREGFQENQIKAFRKYPLDTTVEFLASNAGIAFIGNCMVNCSKSTQQVADALARTPSVARAYYSAIFALSLWWEAKGGLQSIDPQKCSNDFIDLEYAVMGAYSLAFRTTDCRADFVYSAIRRAFADETASAA